jgi:hypothetical protein
VEDIYPVADGNILENDNAAWQNPTIVAELIKFTAFRAVLQMILIDFIYFVEIQFRQLQTLLDCGGWIAHVVDAHVQKNLAASKLAL